MHISVVFFVVFGGISGLLEEYAQLERDKMK